MNFTQKSFKDLIRPTVTTNLRTNSFSCSILNSSNNTFSPHQNSQLKNHSFWGQTINAGQQSHHQPPVSFFKTDQQPIATKFQFDSSFEAVQGHQSIVIGKDDFRFERNLQQDSSAGSLVNETQQSLIREDKKLRKQQRKAQMFEDIGQFRHKQQKLLEKTIDQQIQSIDQREHQEQNLPNCHGYEECFSPQYVERVRVRQTARNQMPKLKDLSRAGSREKVRSIPKFKPSCFLNPESLLNGNQSEESSGWQTCRKETLPIMYTIDEMMHEGTEQDPTQQRLDQYFSTEKQSGQKSELKGFYECRAEALFDKSEMSTPSWFNESIQPSESQVRQHCRQPEEQQQEFARMKKLRAMMR